MEDLVYGNLPLPAELQAAAPPPHPVESLIKNSQKVVFQARAVFPLDIVPDSLIIDLSKIIIVYRELFGFETEHTILLDEVRDVDIDLNYFVGSLKILVSGPGVIWTGIDNLRKEDAHKAKHIIEGLLIAKKEHCDLSQLNDKDLIRQISILGNWDHNYPLIKG